MAAELTLEVSRREGTGKEIAKKLRRDGKVPAIVYGGHREPVSIVVEAKAVSDLIRKSEHGIRSVFLLKMAGSDQQRHAMIKDVQLNPMDRSMKHIDFIRVIMDETVKVSIPIHIIGTAPGVKVEGGILDFQARELHVECLPGSIPDTIDVDVSNLHTHEYIRVSDLSLPEGVKILDDMDRVIVSVTHARAEAAPAEGEETAEPEVLKKGKEDAD